MPISLSNAAAVEGLVFDIRKFAIHDGPGIRTAVFLKGCCLRCIWCHNPESIDPRIEISYKPDKCVACGRCVEVCPHDCHDIDENVHAFDRGACVRCGACAEACPNKALEKIGERRTVKSVLDEVAKDRRYFEKSGGGLTISGGEPMCQPEFTRALLMSAKQAGLHTCLDTCGAVAFEKYRAVLEFVDLFLFDIKETDPAKHKEFTGADNRLILANLLELDAAGARTALRCPIVPGCNDRPDHFAALAGLAGRLKHVVELDLLPYHPYGGPKNAQIGRVNPLEGVAAVPEPVAQDWLARLQALTQVPVRRG